MPDLDPQFDNVKKLVAFKDDRYLQNGCLCLQMDFDMAVFDDTRQILVANVVDRSEFYEDT